MHSLVEQPPCDLQLVELDACVEERRSRHWCARQKIVVWRGLQRAHFRWKDLCVRERFAEECPITTQVLLEQVDTTTMERHHRRVGQRESALDVHRENLM